MERSNVTIEESAGGSGFKPWGNESECQRKADTEDPVGEEGWKGNAIRPIRILKNQSLQGGINSETRGEVGQRPTKRQKDESRGKGEESARTRRTSRGKGERKMLHAGDPYLTRTNYVEKRT